MKPAVVLEIKNGAGHYVATIRRTRRDGARAVPAAVLPSLTSTSGPQPSEAA